jgi:hypothetical protein
MIMLMEEDEIHIYYSKDENEEIQITQDKEPPFEKVSMMIMHARI